MCIKRTLYTALLRFEVPTMRHFSPLEQEMERMHSSEGTPPPTPFEVRKYHKTFIRSLCNDWPLFISKMFRQSVKKQLVMNIRVIPCVTITAESHCDLRTVSHLLYHDGSNLFSYHFQRFHFLHRLLPRYAVKWRYSILQDIFRLSQPTQYFSFFVSKTELSQSGTNLGILNIDRLLREELTHILKATDEEKAILKMVHQQIWLVGAKKQCYNAECLVFTCRLHSISQHAYHVKTPPGYFILSRPSIMWRLCTKYDGDIILKWGRLWTSITHSRAQD